MSKDIIKGEYKVVPVTQVFHDENNARRDLPNIDELAEGIRQQGLINPLTVTNGGDKYIVRAGNRRLAALKQLKVKEVPVIVVSEDDIEVVQLAENLDREDLHALDVSQRLFDLIDKKGAYGGKYTTKQMAEKIRKSVSHVENLVRVTRKLSDEVKQLTRESKYKPAYSVLFAWAALEEDAQLKAFKKWEAQQAKIAEYGKKRSSGDGEGEGEGEGGKKKRGEGAAELKKSQIKFYEPIREALAWKAEQAKGMEKAQLEGALELLNYMFGEVKKFTLVTAADKKAAAKAAEEAAAEAAAEAEETDEEAEA